MGSIKPNSNAHASAVKGLKKSLVNHFIQSVDKKCTHLVNKVKSICGFLELITNTVLSVTK